MEPGWFALIALAFLIVIIGGQVSKKLKSLALHPNCVLLAINDAGGSANPDAIIRQLEGHEHGAPDLRSLERLLTRLERDGKVESRSTGYQILPGEAPVTVYTLTAAGRTSLGLPTVKAPPAAS